MTHPENRIYRRGQPANAGQFADRQNTAPIEALRPHQFHQHRFDRQELLLGLKQVVARLEAAEQDVVIQVVGGAAISLAYWPERHATQDVDAVFGRAQSVTTASTALASEQNWPSDWLNDAAEVFLPSGYGRRSPEWVTIYSGPFATVQVASADTLLAMKLNAATSRPRREIRDLSVLLRLCSIGTVEDAERHFTDFYSEDLNEKAIEAVKFALESGDPRTSSVAPDPWA